MDNPPSAPTPSILVSDSTFELDLDQDINRTSTSTRRNIDRVQHHLHLHHHHHQGRRHHRPQPHQFHSNSSSRPASPHNSSDCESTTSSSSAYKPMVIRNAKQPLAPPPLPPPRYIEDLARGYDSGWKWGNSFNSDYGDSPIAVGHSYGKGTTLAPINPSSSLFGGHARPPLVRRDETFHFEDGVQRPAGARGSPSVSETETVVGPSSAPVSACRGSIGGGSSPGGLSPIVDTSKRSLGRSLSHSLETSLVSKHLAPGVSTREGLDSSNSFRHGEKPLSEMSVELSSNAYDQHLLSKIGGPTSPPRRNSSLLDTSVRRPSRFQTSFSALKITDGSLSPQDGRWPHSGPPSAGISPGTRIGGFADYVGFPHSAQDGGAHSPMEIDQFSVARERYIGFPGSRNGDEPRSHPSTSNRGSYDQNMFPESDVDIAMDDVGTSSYRRGLRERTSSCVETMSPASRNTMKRRASSPPHRMVTDDPHSFHPSSGNGETEHRKMSDFPFNHCASPNGRYQSSHGSISSVSSMSLRTGSYASSTGLSIGASSISSYERPSPGGISPTSDVDSIYDKNFVTPLAHQKSAPVLAIPRPSQFHESAEMKGNGMRKGSTSSISLSKPAPPRIGRLFLCECCPKKPRKLESLEDLRAHELEKQYMCNFCNKRFKNKNEAERHRNSLHLRRHSWSCSSLSSYEAAFHASASPSCQTPTGPSHDSCGYCGAEFSNFPQPEWDERIEHLTSVHKFGECNQAKKFYRADHFRQHLKHSHAGASGKWTNILENACMKEEPALEGSLASIGEQPAGAPEHTEMSMRLKPAGSRAAHTIDEVIEET
ncbi:hypothetical protein FQN57_005806 [Myotisia sp. PD_48]|nr:hypothetical protein FQN57_005806 [Myotisia sp. PD_48]